MSAKNFICQGLVLKRSNVGETDRVVVLLTPEKGKIACIAKGVRKLKSSRRATLEPGNIVKIYCVNTKSMPLLTQAELVEDTTAVRSSLISIRQLTQLLEVVDRLFVEEELDEHIFADVLEIRSTVIDQQLSNGLVKKKLLHLIERMGFEPSEGKDKSVLDIVASISERPMRSFEYLSPLRQR